MPFDGGSKREIATGPNGYSDALIQRTNDDGLPCATGESGSSDPVRGDVGMLAQIVQSLAYRQIEQTGSAQAHEIQVRATPMVVLGNSQFAHSQPFQTESVHALKRIIYATLLLIVSRLSIRGMTVQING